MADPDLGAEKEEERAVATPADDNEEPALIQEIQVIDRSSDSNEFMEFGNILIHRDDFCVREATFRGSSQFAGSSVANKRFGFVDNAASVGAFDGTDPRFKNS